MYTMYIFSHMSSCLPCLHVESPRSRDPVGTVAGNVVFDSWPSTTGRLSWKTGRISPQKNIQNMDTVQYSAIPNCSLIMFNDI